MEQGSIDVTLDHPLGRVSDEQLAKRGLPEVAYIDNKYDKSKDAPQVIAVKRGEEGFYPIFTQLSADELNAGVGVTPAQREAMHFGSMFGWDKPGADPARFERFSN